VGVQAPRAPKHPGEAHAEDGRTRRGGVVRRRWAHVDQLDDRDRDAERGIDDAVGPKLARPRAPARHEDERAAVARAPGAKLDGLLTACDKLCPRLPHAERFHRATFPAFAARRVRDARARAVRRETSRAA
jgi:hypothetical protein